MVSFHQSLLNTNEEPDKLVDISKKDGEEQGEEERPRVVGYVCDFYLEAFLMRESWADLISICRCVPLVSKTNMG